MSDLKLHRRTFVKAASSAALAATLPRPVFGANDRVGVAIVGLNGIGSMHYNQFAQMEDVNVVALCDVDSSVLDRVMAKAEKKPLLVGDFRKVLDMKDVDVVVVSAPDHWHALIATRACEAGKDVYVEKPLGHNIREGRAVVDAARKHGRIVQVGLQQRSGPHWIHAVERIKNGEIGKITSVHVWNAWSPEEMRGDLGSPADGEAPEGVDYDMWLGPAPKRPFNKVRFHGSWYFFWDYSGGMMSAWGVHLFDVVMWAMGPEIDSVAAYGGKLAHPDIRETPDTAHAVFQCPAYSMCYSMRHGNGWRPHGDMDHGIEFFGSEGTLQINRWGYHLFRDADRDTREPYDSERADESHGGGLTDYWRHKRNLLDCIRSRNKPNADVEMGHIGSIPGHLANVAYRVGRSIRWDGENESIPEDPEAAPFLTREYREPWVL